MKDLNEDKEKLTFLNNFTGDNTKLVKPDRIIERFAKSCLQ
jgi:hypothetical protein